MNTDANRKKTSVCMHNEVNKENNTICEASVLVLLMEMFSEWYDIHTKFYEDLFRHSSNINIIM
jgi:hypothetical protein